VRHSRLDGHRHPQPDSILLFALALTCGGGFVVAPGCVVVGTLALAIVLLLCAPRVGASVLLAAVVGVGLGAWRATERLDVYEHDLKKTRGALAGPRRCAGNVRVIRSPEWRGDEMRWDADVEHLDCEGRILRGGRVRLVGGPMDLTRNERVSVIAQIAPIQLLRNPELPSPIPRSALRGVSLSGRALSVEDRQSAAGLAARIDRARRHARERIQADFPKDAEPLARALVLGENDLEDDDRHAFQRSGLAHLLAVSGTHLVFAVVAIVRLLQWALLRIGPLAERCDVARIASAVGMPAALLYADFSGGSGSAWRAAWMLTAAFAARASCRHPSMARTIAASLLVGCAFEPLLVFDISFLLSVCATAGLAVLGQPWSRAVIARTRPGVVRFLLVSLVVTAAAMLACTPLLAAMSGELSLAGLFANVIAGPIGELAALPLCLIHPLLDGLGIASLERGVALAGGGALLSVQEIAHVAAGIEWLVIPVPAPTPWHYAVMAVSGTGAWLATSAKARGGWFLLGLLGLVMIEIGAWRAGNPSDVLRVTFVDVGQGDAALIDLPNGELVLVDGGGTPMGLSDPGERVLLPLLRARRRSRVDIAVLSHTDADHLNGLATVAKSIPVGELWTSSATDDSSKVYQSLLGLLRRRRVRIRTLDELCGNPRRYGAAELRVLGPCPGRVPGVSRNDNSLILSASLGEHSALFTGDAEAAEEELLIDAKIAHHDLLKVGHHGSPTSSSANFIGRISPELAVISSGVRNRFGHPSAAVLSRLTGVGSRIVRTDNVGALVWTSDGRTMTVSFGKALSEEPRSGD
jgi:competence protein ComEC